MSRVILALLLALSTVTLTADLAGAKPTGPSASAECTFVDGFARFREAIGPEIVGDCETDQVFDASGDGEQQTTGGLLVWSAQQKLAGFTDGTRVWWDGVGGIGSSVTIGALSDRLTIREPVVAPAARVFELASLDPDDLGPFWRYGDVPDGSRGAFTFPCSPTFENRAFGSLEVWLFDDSRKLAISHMLTAIPDDDVNGWRPGWELFAAHCSEWTEQTADGEFDLRSRMTPYVELGDDAFVLQFEITRRSTGERRSHHIGHVRYGGLISMVAISSREGRSSEELLSDLKWLAARAHDRVQHAAWYLRT